MERMELMKLTPDKKEGPVSAVGGARPKIPKVQKSASVASESVSSVKSFVDEVQYYYWAILQGNK